MIRLAFSFRLLALATCTFFLLAQASCSRAPARVPISAAPGTLHETLSVQVSAAQNKKAMIIDSADLAELLGPFLREGLRKKGFVLAGKDARQHLVVHVAEAARGSGSVNASCKLEIYVYPSWPGKLEPKKNEGQLPNGTLAGQTPQLSLSMDLKDQRRLRVGTTATMHEAAEYFAERVAEELWTVRESTPPALPKPAPIPVTPSADEATPKAADEGFEIAYRLEQGPGNLTFTPAGRLFVSLHQFFDPPYPVAEVQADGSLREFAGEAHLDSVLGIQSDENGVVWMLDNGMKSTHRPRLVGWHSVRDKLVADIDLTKVAPKNTFLNDLVIDLDHDYAYLADPAGGDNAALVVVDLKKESARRVLIGHASVIPEDTDLVIDGVPVEVAQGDGTFVRPRVGVNPIAADAENIWLYYGPMHGTSLYRIETSFLRDEGLSPDELAQKVQHRSAKPISDGMSIDRAGNIYLGSLSDNAIWKISADGSSEIIAQSETLAWVDAFSFGPDGNLYAVVNQLHKSAPLHRGTNTTVPPYLIVRIPTQSAGVVGR